MQCIVYAKGQTTLSQLLLSRGLGFKERAFKDEEFNALFTDALNSAKINKRGVWKSDIPRNCIAEIQNN